MQLVSPTAIEPVMEDEAELIRRAQKGDSPAFAHLIDRYYERLHRFLFRLTRDTHLSEDLTQETFLKAFANLSRFQAGSYFKAWLFRIAHNNWVSHHRATKKVRDTLPEEISEENEEEPLDLLIGKESLTRISEAIEQLPEDYRIAFLLRIDEQLSFREIGEILGLTEETARWRVFKARRMLQDLLGGSNEPE